MAEAPTPTTQDQLIGSPVTKATSYSLPSYVTDPSLDISGFIKDYFSSMLNPSTGLINGYSQDRVAGIDPLQQQALNTVPDAVGAWGNQFNTGLNAMNNASSMFGNLGQYDPSKMQQHLNPYMGGVLDQISMLGNRNLMENVLPQVNSTFAGNGQFGSTRNADFTNRALRDNQQAISNAQATAMNQAYGQAGQDYLSWDKSGQSAAGNLGTLGQALAGTAVQGGQQNWNDLSNAFKMGGENRAIAQEGLTAGYEDWQNQWKLPLDATSSLGGILAQLKQGVQPTQYQVSTQTTNEDSSLYNLLSKIISGVFD